MKLVWRQILAIELKKHSASCNCQIIDWPAVCNSGDAAILAYDDESALKQAP